MDLIEGKSIRGCADLEEAVGVALAPTLVRDARMLRALAEALATRP
jgi:hypothetical protein